MFPYFYKSRKTKLIQEINVTPMVDVMLVLLIIFMVTAPMLVSQINVELPHANAPSKKQVEDPIEISITKERKIYILNTVISINKLEKKLISITQRNFSRKILICGDAFVPYSQVVEVIDKVKIAGFNKIGLVTTKN